MNAKHWTRPKFGDVVWCRFPYGGQQTTARHPCLVLETSTDASGQVWLLVAGGSSCNKSGRWERTPASSDFLVQGNQLGAAGLSHATAFHFEATQFDDNGVMVAGTVLTLPYVADYFLAVYPANTPKAGSIDIMGQAAVREAFIVASKNSQLVQIIEQEKQRFSKAVTPPTRQPGQ